MVTYISHFILLDTWTPQIFLNMLSPLTYFSTCCHLSHIAQHVGTSHTSIHAIKLSAALFNMLTSLKLLIMLISLSCTFRYVATFLQTPECAHHSTLQHTDRSLRWLYKLAAPSPGKNMPTELSHFLVCYFSQFSSCWHPVAEFKQVATPVSLLIKLTSGRMSLTTAKNILIEKSIVQSMLVTHTHI